MTIPNPPSPQESNSTASHDTFYIRLMMAVLYRAGLDVMEDDSKQACDAKTFLESEFALLALNIIRAELASGGTWSDVSDYLGQLQRVAKERMATSRRARQIHELFEEFTEYDIDSKA